MDIIQHVHSTPVYILDTTPLMMPISVGCLSPTGSKDSVSTSGAMPQGVMKLVTAYATARVQLVQVEQLHHLLVMIFTASPALTHHHLSSGTPPTHSGTAKAVTVVASAAAAVVHRGSGSPCLKRLHLTLKFVGVSRIGLPMTKLALNNLKFTCTNCITATSTTITTAA